MKILNAYSGLGGNRKHWDGDKHDITAVEKNHEIAEAYRNYFPQDKVIEADAHEYIKENHDDFDFIWASPPCPTHSSIRKAGAKNGQYQEKYPDMKLWQEIIFLNTYFKGDYVVENVESYYRQPVKPQKRNQHYFWSNFTIPEINIEEQKHNHGNITKWKEYYGFDLSNYSFDTVNKRKVLRNCIHPKIGKAILKSRNSKQQTLAEVKASQ